jgi:hypothetical protein
MVWLRPLCILAGLVACGCSAPRGPFLVTEADPANKIPAIVQAVEDKDLSAAKQMVIDLDNDDPAVRFYAIEGLERLTGQTLGYRYYDNDLARQPAIKRWQAWVDMQPKK